jgi:SEC-C motif-containing protein
LHFAACCGRWNQDDVPAPDAESLMRSRYSAYVSGDERYLLATWHASKRPSSVPPEPQTKWLGLEVRSHRQLDADHAEVEFVARFRVAGGKAVRLHEVSRFVRQEGKWYYLDGEFRD